jgi:TRAP-type C4-dicarboxylate transport system permease large subunit
MTLTLIAFAVLLAISFARVPIAFAMGLVGFVGFALLRGFEPALGQLEKVAFATGLNYELTVLPLFILMGNFVTSARLSEDLYRAANSFLGHRRGGLAMATVVACGGFASVCGSSMATAATMAKVAMPSMRKYGYSDKLAAASIASGGTLGILIPPSTIMVIYGIMTQTNIGHLFAAGILPGIVAVCFYLLAVQWVVRRDPKAGPPAQRQGWRERMAALRGVGWFALAAVLILGATRLRWADAGGAFSLGFDLARAAPGKYLLDPQAAGIVGALVVFAMALIFKGVVSVIALFLLVMVGIYGGIFTPTEAAGIGAAGAFLFALIGRELTWRKLYTVLLESAVTTAMMFTVLMGAVLFSDFINFTGFAEALVKFVNELGINRWGVIFAIVIIYILLGTAMEELSMILLTVPVFFPLVMSLGFDQALGVPPGLVGVWFGILIVCVVEIGMISPPVGVNIFVLRSVLPDVPTKTIFSGVMPFFTMDILRIAVLTAFPIISLWLPSHMK